MDPPHGDSKSEGARVADGLMAEPLPFQRRDEVKAPIRVALAKLQKALMSWG